MTGLLVANRGEIALRIMRTAAARGMCTVAVYSEDDRTSPHVTDAHRSVALPGSGPEAYLDAAAICAAAVSAQATMVHPGYGFLSESAELAEGCAAHDLIFVGPDGPTLRLLGDKSATRELAARCSIPVLPATTGPTSKAAARDFALSSGLSSVIVKASAGGGGRGIRIVEDLRNLDHAIDRCRSEAARGFGVPNVYVEAYLPRARHIEVQVAGDGSRSPVHLFDRECTGQRRHQKMVETAPARHLHEDIREALYGAALALAAAVRLRGLATFEFLVDADNPELWYFIEANPRLQVEHGITEQITGLDLVGLQLDLARERTLTDLRLAPQTREVPKGIAIEARITGGPGPGSSGRVGEVKFPTDSSIRIESHLRPGMRVGTGYDPLLAKLIAHRPDGDFDAAATTLNRALGEVVLGNLETDIETLEWFVGSSEFRRGVATTRTIDDHLASASTIRQPVSDAELILVRAPAGGTVVAVSAKPGSVVHHGDVLVTLEAMKMETDVRSPVAGVVVEAVVEVGQLVQPDIVLATVEPGADQTRRIIDSGEIDRTAIRSDLADITARHRRTLDEERTDAVEHRHRLGKRTARENLSDLFDSDSFHEYGPLVVAAQRQRRALSDLERTTPADGLVAGFGTVDGRPTAALAYDYTVLAGTQGLQSHKKAERIFELAGRRGSPVVIFGEGGGGRPGDTDDMSRATRMDLGTFVALGRLNGVVPTIGIASGRCFAGNAALLGACDLVVATRDSRIGLGGPAMIEGGGLGSFAADDIGPPSVQGPNGVIDILVDDEAEAVAVVRRYLSFFRDPSPMWTESDQRVLRHIVPERSNRAFDIRTVIATLADQDSVLELRPLFGPGVVTALVRIEGRSVAIVANDGSHLGGTIGSAEADKMARFLQLCDAYEVPVVSLCDTAGFLVGPDAERTATVRHVSRLFVIAPTLTVPFCTVIVRKAFGLGGQAMAGGSFRVPDAIVAWPTGELGAMGPEGAVRLGFRRELDAIEDPDERDRVYRMHLEQYRKQGSVVNAASVFEIDDVIDPASTRSWITSVFSASRVERASAVRRRIDTW
ncbi:carbamoyl-phosphate synthase large subunit [Nocardia sp. CA2R105]|uniref:carboxyl transferase domain-containing protein n=1 Tax=Nocardia coffeae TaxID=2873381 RepID=UPI001CA78BAA|nr:carboxyl transferase domain-containing protein [Nocardia coffeae]MBY8860379.1 carbamoyl-phosphate synthase large subunit [Nocardia coffeae]